MLEEIEHANNGEGPTPLATYTEIGLNEIMDAIEERDQAEDKIRHAVTRARSEGATWAMIGQALGMTRQGALKHYREPAAA